MNEWMNELLFVIFRIPTLSMTNYMQGDFKIRNSVSFMKRSPVVAHSLFKLWTIKKLSICCHEQIVHIHWCADRNLHNFLVIQSHRNICEFTRKLGYWHGCLQECFRGGKNLKKWGIHFNEGAENKHKNAIGFKVLICFNVFRVILTAS